MKYYAKYIIDIHKSTTSDTLSLTGQNNLILWTPVIIPEKLLQQQQLRRQMFQLKSTNAQQQQQQLYSNEVFTLQSGSINNDASCQTEHDSFCQSNKFDDLRSSFTSIMNELSNKALSNCMCSMNFLEDYTCICRQSKVEQINHLLLETLYYCSNETLSLFKILLNIFDE